MRRVFISILLVAVSATAIAQTEPRVTNVSRSLGPTSGGTLVTLFGSNLLPTVACLLPCPTTVTFGKVPASLKGETRSFLNVVTPPHAPGTVDVTISIAGEPPIVLANAFTYSTEEEAQFEQVLLPLYFDGVLHGAHGSEWTTSLWIRNSGSDAVQLAPWTCPDGQLCAESFPLLYTLPPSRSLQRLAPLDVSDGNPSRLLYVSQAGSGDVSFSLRFADRSRGLANAGIDLPVIREREALYTAAQLFSVPMGHTYRALLRLYEIGGVSSRFRITIYPQSELEVPSIHSEELTAMVQDGPFPAKAGYAQFDITGLLRLDQAWPETVRIEITPLTAGSRYWSFVSLTNNDTQFVTLVTPQ
jgi:IPT/TIG domain